MSTPVDDFIYKENRTTTTEEKKVKRTNLHAYFELRKGNPDLPKIQKLLKKYVKVVAIQSAMQFTIIFIMAEFATGFSLHL